MWMFWNIRTPSSSLTVYCKLKNRVRGCERRGVQIGSDARVVKIKFRTRLRSPSRNVISKCAFQVSFRARTVFSSNTFDRYLLVLECWLFWCSRCWYSSDFRRESELIGNILHSRISTHSNTINALEHNQHTRTQSTHSNTGTDMRNCTFALCLDQGTC